MKYVSIDIETTGLNPENSQILSIGAVIEDTNNIRPIEKLPKFHAAIKRKNISGNIYAINMNKKLIENINSYICAKTKKECDEIIDKTGLQFLDEYEIVQKFINWLVNNNINESVLKYDGTIKNLNVAGKNFGTFDLKFLEKLPGWKSHISINSRILDPSILFVDWYNDIELPNLYDCKKRCNLQPEVKHDALQDAIDVVKLLRKKYKN